MHCMCSAATCKLLVPESVNACAEGGKIITRSYCLHPVDLRQPAAVEAALKLAKLRPDVPTYIMAECVLVYLRPSESNTVVRWLAEHLQQAAFVLYEQVRQNLGSRLLTKHHVQPEI